MSSEQAVSKLLQDNLVLVFSETSHEKRLQGLHRLWSPNGDCLFIDHFGVFKNHNDISILVGTLLDKFVGKVFSVRGSVQILAYDEENDIQIARLLWTFGDILGEDVATIAQGRIQKMYTFIDE
ncbi:hypothetical protein BT63DRAFT_443840 [Microthyrium microscopicum]|uniref:Uncharacterized protein n=1 Tax=Microthyrium microscopicum TaxID=703497 RepID=A0A6A6TXY7_9PEZI|nr:hypothetical protein BT63DRAFT_443840 [Microthyrium microscopicum]